MYVQKELCYIKPQGKLNQSDNVLSVKDLMTGFVANSIDWKLKNYILKYSQIKQHPLTYKYIDII